MKTILDLKKEVKRVENMKRDFLVPTALMRMQSNGHSVLHVDFDKQFDVTKNTHGQIAQFLDMPSAYYNRLREKTHIRSGQDSLFDASVNALLADAADLRFVRTLDANARAFLSKNFTPELDNYDVLEAALVCLMQAGLGQQEVISSSLTDTNMYLKVVNPRLQGEVRVGDVVQAGFILSNSEVGVGSLSIRQFIYRLTCLNGAVTEDAYRQRHVGKRLTADEEGVVFADDTRRQEAKLRLLKMRDHITSALDEHKFQSTLSAMRSSTEIKIEKRPMAVVEVTRKRYGLTEPETAVFETEFIKGGDLTLYGLSQAMTATARELKDYDRAVELETYGGQMHFLNKTDIKHLVEA